MPLEIGLWRIENDSPQAVISSGIDDESRLEQIVLDDVGLLGLGDLMVLGSQVPTDHGARVDVLAIDSEGVLYVIELKRNRTPRDVVAQALDYGSWVGGLGADRIASIFESGGFSHAESVEESFAEHFGAGLPEAINESHRLIIVASAFDPSTERIVDYLLQDFGVPINVVFFKCFVDGEREYLARSWFRDPVAAEERSRTSASKRTSESWNGRDYYIAFGDEARRDWEDARRFGFVSGGGGPRFSKPLLRLQPGHRVFVYLPQRGYVGFGEVIEPAKRIGEFDVEIDGVRRRLVDAPLRNPNIKADADDPERCEYVVGVRWDRAIPSESAFWEAGMFANQNTACRFRDRFTLEKLYEHFGVENGPALTDEQNRSVAQVVGSAS